MFSGEWFFVQGIWFLSACVLGCTVYALSDRYLSRVLLTLGVLWIILVALPTLVLTPSKFHTLLFYLQIPLGIAAGCLLWTRSSFLSNS